MQRENLFKVDDGQRYLLDINVDSQAHLEIEEPTHKWLVYYDQECPVVNEETSTQRLQVKRFREEVDRSCHTIAVAYREFFLNPNPWFNF